MGEDLKRCPYCGEEILAIAKKCKHCGSELGIDSNASATQENKPVTDYGLFLLAIPVVGTMLIWFWVSGMNLIQSPGDSMALILLSTILGTALVAAMEANKNGVKTDKTLGTRSPISWFFTIALVWVVGYPLYLYKRKYSGLANRFVAGLLIMIVFIGSWVVMTTAIEDQQAKVRGEIGELQRELNNLAR